MHEASGIWHNELRDAAANLTGFRTAAKLGVPQHSAKTGESEDKRLSPLGRGQSKYWAERIRSPNDICTDDPGGGQISSTRQLSGLPSLGRRLLGEQGERRTGFYLRPLAVAQSDVCRSRAQSPPRAAEPHLATDAVHQFIEAGAVELTGSKAEVCSDLSSSTQEPECPSSD